MKITTRSILPLLAPIGGILPMLGTTVFKSLAALFWVLGGVIFLFGTILAAREQTRTKVEFRRTMILIFGVIILLNIVLLTFSFL